MEFQTFHPYIKIITKLLKNSLEKYGWTLKTNSNML